MQIDQKNLKLWFLRWGGGLLVFILFFILFYFSGKQLSQETQKGISLTPKVKTLAEFSRQLTLEKPGTIVSSQDIQVTSQANGKVARILVKEGDTVKGGQPIVQLSDTIASYKLQAERAKNGLDRAILTKTQTETTLNQQIQQAENAYKQAQQAFQFAQKTSETAVKQAGLGLSGAESQFEALKKNFLSQKIALVNFMNTVVDAGDALLGVTDYYEDRFEGKDTYVGAKDLKQKIEATKALRELYNLRDQINALADIPNSAELLTTATQSLDRWYVTTIAFAKLMQEVMKNSISSEGSLGAEEINKQLQLFQTYQVWPSTQQARSAFIAYSNQVEAQLNGSSTMEKEKAGLNYENTLNTTQNSLFTAETALKNAKVNYETLLASKDTQLDLLGNAITDAKIAYESALIQYNKLTLRSPVSGVIGSILISEGQELWVGTPAFKVSGTKKQQIEVYMTAEEYQYIQESLPVQIVYQDQMMTWLIDAMSTVADGTNLFKATILLEKEVPLLGDVAKVIFPIKVPENTLLPLEKVKILNENEGTIPILSGTTIVQLPIKIKKICGSFVELKHALPWTLALVMDK